MAKRSYILGLNFKVVDWQLTPDKKYLFQHLKSRFFVILMNEQGVRKTFWLLQQLNHFSRILHNNVLTLSSIILTYLLQVEGYVS